MGAVFVCQLILLISTKDNFCLVIYIFDKKSVMYVICIRSGLAHLVERYSTFIAAIQYYLISCSKLLKALSINQGRVVEEPQK